MASHENNENNENNPEEAETTEAVRTGKKRTTADAGLPPKPKKKYAKRAEVWKHFIQREDNESISNCRYCHIEIGCDTKKVGTSPMKGHIERCKSFKDFDAQEKQKILSSDNRGNMRVVKYDPQLFRRSVNQMVVVNELPFSFVESEGWKILCFNMMPMYQTFSRRTCCREIVGMYLQEKAELKHLFSVEKQRVSLTTDIWVSNTTSYNYMVVTCHWIDRNWKMQKRILSFKVITDHKGNTIAGQLLECLEEWGITKVFSITVDNAKGNDKALEVFKEQFILRGEDALVRDGEYMHIRCCAHILNLIVGDGLKKAKKSIVSIRNAIKYARSSFTRLKSFALRCDTGKVCRGSLPLDVVTRWNSTYLMLTSALKLRVAFEKLLAEDKLYDEYFREEDEKTKLKRVGPPITADWDAVSLLCKFLKIFYKCTLTFSASTTVTSTISYNEIVNIERDLIKKCGNSSKEVRDQANIMRDKFDKYWDGLLNMNPLVIVGSVFDPRNKMQFANLCIEQLYGKDTIETRQLKAKVSKTMTSLFDEYYLRLRKPEVDEETVESEPPSSVQEISDDEDGCERMDLMHDKLVKSKGQRDASTELQIYLAEPLDIRVENTLGFPYDVLSWWKSNSPKFPVLSELARDVLAIQISSVASESVFSTSGRVLDPYRSSLTPFMVEVLLCTQQWLRVSFKSEADIANLVQMMEEVVFFESLDSRNAVATM